jgi:predicted acyl esterase
MNWNSKARFLGIFILLLLAGCGGRTEPASDLEHIAVQQAPPPQIGGMLPMPSEAELLEPSYITRSSSDIQGNANGWTPNVYGDGSFEQIGNSLSINTESKTRVSALYRLVFADGDIYPKQVPFIYPYELSFNTNGLGPIYVLLPDYKRNRWTVVDGTSFIGSTITIPGGLLGNHGNEAGSIVFGIVAWDGSDLQIDSIGLLLPDLPGAGEPIEYHEYIEAADGTMLATDIYLPYKSTSVLIPPPPYPAVLIRTPYDKGLIDSSNYATLTSFNVAVIVQYFRGRLNDSGAWPDSGGSETLFTEHAGPDHTDALDTVDWLDDRHWFGGKLVISGPSALGLWTYQAAPALGDRLTGFYPVASSANVANWAMYENGVLKQGNVEGWLGINGYPTGLLDDVIANFADAAYREKYDYDSQAGQVTAPAYHETGWWDVNVDSTIDSWQALQSGGGTGAAGNQWLIIGPWDHSSFRTREVGELTFPSTTRHDPSVLPVLNPGDTWDGLEWGSGLFVPFPFPPPFSTPANHVLIYYIGEEGSEIEPHNTWYELPSWPPAYTEQSLFLTATSTLEDIAPVSADNIGFNLDPVNPISTNGGANLPGLLLPLAGPYDQQALLPNIDILEYRGDVLGMTTAIAGPILANLFISTSAVDSDVCVKLIDEYPDGRKMLVSDGIMRFSYAHPGGFAPDETLELNWNIGSRAYVFGAGHRIVVHIQGSNYPRYNPNPGNGEDYFDASEPFGAEVQFNSLKTGASQASRIILPMYDPSA